MSTDAFKLDLHRFTDIGIQNSMYLRWKRWRKEPLQEKLEKITSHNHEVMDILLSFSSEKVPNEAITCMRKLLYHPSYQIRTAVITVLSTRPECIRASDVLLCLTDDSPNVRMGGIYALNVCPNFWGELASTLSVSINDENTDI